MKLPSPVTNEMQGIQYHTIGLNYSVGPPAISDRLNVTTWNRWDLLTTIVIFPTVVLCWFYLTVMAVRLYIYPNYSYYRHKNMLLYLLHFC